MGLMPAGGGNPFARIDKQSVIGTLKSCGSRDPDVLYAQTEQLKQGGKHLSLLGKICLGGGALFTITIFMAWFGIPLLLFGWWLVRFGKGNMEAVDAGFKEFMASPPPAKAGVIG